MKVLGEGIILEQQFEERVDTQGKRAVGIGLRQVVVAVAGGWIDDACVV